MQMGNKGNINLFVVDYRERRVHTANKTGTTGGELH